MKSVRFPWKPFKPTKIYLKIFFRFVFSLPAVQIDVACKPCNAEMLNIYSSLNIRHRLVLLSFPFGKHDCHEFLALFLDGLHHELNCVTDSSNNSSPYQLDKNDCAEQRWR